MKTIKITVIKKIEHKDLMEKYENPISNHCNMNVGDIFYSIDGKKPKDLCSAAWRSIKPYANDLAKGEKNFFDGWMKNEESAMISCEDGFRPVSFYIETYDRINAYEDLSKLADKEYAEFSSKLNPTVDPKTFIGVRIPDIRAYAKEKSKNPNFTDYLDTIPHYYHEENILHGVLLNYIKDYNKTIDYLEKFLPYIDSWDVCDTISIDCFEDHKKEVLKLIKKWIKSDHVYTKRFGIITLMKYYLDEDFDPAHLKLITSIKSEDYYVNMARAWYIATALAKQYEFTIKVIEEKRLDVWTHNKSIQKAIESYRISDKNKVYLKALKLKNVPKK